MRTTDDRFGPDLEAAAGRGLPGVEAFLGRVMDGVADGGGERTISAEVPGSPARRLLGLAAAALLGAVGVWAVAGGYLRRPAEPAGEEAADEDLAAPGIELEPAKTAVPLPRPIRIAVKEDGTVLAGGEARTFEALKSWLLAETRESFDGAPSTAASERDVLLRADRRARWRTIQWVLQTCADPEVRLRRIWWAVPGGAVPAFLPTDRGLGPRAAVVEELPGPAGTTVPVLRTRTWEISGAALEETGQDMKDALAGIRADPEVPVEIRGDADVYFAQIVRALDQLRAAGAREILFGGAPPPPPGK